MWIKRRRTNERQTLCLSIFGRLGGMNETAYKDKKFQWKFVK